MSGLPAGFTLDPAPVGDLPPGFTLDGAPTDAAQAQDARDAAATRIKRPARDVPQYTPNAPTTPWSDVGNSVDRIAAHANDALAETVGRGADELSHIGRVPGAVVSGLVSGQPIQWPNDHTIEHGIKEYYGSNRRADFGSGPIPPAKTTGEQALDAGGKMLGENLPLALGVTGIAGSGARFAEQSAPVLKDAFKHFANRYLDTVAQHPKSLLAGEGLSSVEGGAIGEVGRQNQEDQNHGPVAQRVVESVGQTLGPIATNALPTVLGIKAALKSVPYVGRGVRSLAETVAGMVPEEYRPARVAPLAGASEKRAADAANSTVGKELSTVMAKPESQAGVAEARQLEQDIPGFKPGVARATNDPVLLNTQKKLDSEATGDELRSSQEAHDANTQSLRDKFKSLAPKPEDTVSDTRSPIEQTLSPGPKGPIPAPQDVVHGAEAARVQDVENRISGAQKKTAMQQGTLQQRLRAAGEALPDAERADQGAKFRDIHTKAEQASSDQTTALRNAIARPDTVIPVGEGQMSVNDALDRRAAINQEMRRYNSATARTVDDVKRMDDLGAERRAIDDAIESVNLPGMKEYRDYYKTQHVPKFEEGAGRDVGRYDRFGYDKNKVPDEKVLAQFGGPNNISAAKQFTATHGTNPDAVQLMVDHQLGRLKAEAIDAGTGQIKEGAVNKFLTKNKELLDALPPQVREAVSAKNPDQLYARLGDLEQRQRKLADMHVQSRLGKNPEDTISAAMNDWQVMRDLKSGLKGNPQHEAALTRAVMDRAPDPADAKKFGAWLENNGRMLREVLSPQHLADLKTVARASEIHNRLPRPQGAVELPKSLGGKVGAETGVSIPSAIGSWLSIMRGRTSPLTEVPAQAVKMANRLNDRAVNAAWREALSNPDVARTLGTVVRSKQATPMQMSKLHTYLLASGLLPSNVKDNDQK